MTLFPGVGKVLAGIATDDVRRISDTDLLGSFIATRDEAAFAALVNRHGPVVQGVCRRVLGHAQDAEDAAQAVFLVLARHANRVRNPKVLGSWLHGVAVRVSRKALAQRQRVLPLTDMEQKAARPERTWTEALQAIDASLATLPETLRLPLIMCYLEGMTRDEAANRLGWPLNTFRGRLERGREKLRAALSRRGFTLAAGLLVAMQDSPAKASLSWVISTTAAATRLASPVPSVEALSKGALPAMSSPIVRVISGLCAIATAAGILAAALIASGLIAAQKPSQPAQAASPPIPAMLLVPDPKAPPVAKEFAGTWRSVILAPVGTATRTETLQFVDGKYLVWHLNLRSPGVDSSVTLHGTYEFTKDGELVFDVLTKWAGEEKLSVKPNEAHRVYRFKWTKKPSEFDLVNQEAKGDNTDSPWATRHMKLQTDASKAEHEVPGILQKVERIIKKEPKYSNEPLYLLLAFGSEAKFRVWLVLDGTTLYVDRNGNGDLTEDGKKYDGSETARKDENGKLKGGFFHGIELTEPTGAKHTNLIVSLIQLGTGTYAKLGVTVEGKVAQLAGPTNLKFNVSAKDAQVVHFGGTEVVVRPSLSMPGDPDANAPAEFRVQVGTPGIGAGSFASFMSEKVAEGICPVAEFEFTPLKKDEPRRKITVKLTEKCCGDQFFAKLVLPEGVKTGVNAANVTLSFPACPWGKVPSAVYLVDVIPLRK